MDPNIPEDILSVFNKYPYTLTEEYNSNYNYKSTNIEYNFSKGQLLLTYILPFDLKYVSYRIKTGSYTGISTLVTIDKLLELFDFMTNSETPVQYSIKHMIKTEL